MAGILEGNAQGQKVDQNIVRKMNSRLAQKLSLEGNWNFENNLSASSDWSKTHDVFSE